MTIVALVSGMFTKVVIGKTIRLEIQHTILRLARELIGLMDEGEPCEVTAPELLELIDSGDGREVTSNYPTLLSNVAL